MLRAFRDFVLSLLLIPVFLLLGSGVLFGLTIAAKHPHPVTIFGGALIVVICIRVGMACWGRYTGR